MRPLKNVPLCPIPASGSNFNPQNTVCIPVVNPPKIGGGLKFSPSLTLNKMERFSEVSSWKLLDGVNYEKAVYRHTPDR